MRIAQKLPVRNSWERLFKKLPIPLPICYYFELVTREVLANTGYLRFVHAVRNVRSDFVLRFRGQEVGRGLVVDGIAKFQAKTFGYSGPAISSKENPLFCWLEGDSLRNFRS